MALTSTYSILFELKILHHFFLNRGVKHFSTMTEEEQAEALLYYDIADFFHITPSDLTTNDLARHQCLFKPTATGLIVGLKTEVDDGPPKKHKPFQSLDNDLTFTFHIHLKDFNLLNYTALPLSDNSGRLYLFTNHGGALSKTFPSLSAHPHTFVTGHKYMPGDMVTDNGATPSKLHTANLKTTINPGVNGEWLTENIADGLPMSYAGETDRYRVVRRQMLYRVKTAGVEPVVEIKTAAGTVVEVKNDILPGEFRTIQLDLRGLPEGLYSLHAESSDLTYQDDLQFYLLQGQEVPFAIVQCAVKSDTTSYDMLDSEGFTRSPVYELRLRNRATHWRYIGKQFNASSVTAAPMPLTRLGIIENVTVPNKDGTPVDDLPNPEITMIKAEAMTVETERRFYSEIHIH